MRWKRRETCPSQRQRRCSLSWRGQGEGVRPTEILLHLPGNMADTKSIYGICSWVTPHLAPMATASFATESIPCISIVLHMMSPGFSLMGIWELLKRWEPLRTRMFVGSGMWLDMSGDKEMAPKDSSSQCNGLENSSLREQTIACYQRLLLLSMPLHVFLLLKLLPSLSIRLYLLHCHPTSFHTSP